MAASDVHRARETFSVGAGPYGAGELRITSFSGRERMSKPFAFDLTVTFSGAEDEGAFVRAVLGQPAWLRFEHREAPRTIGGIVARASVLGSHTQGFSYRLHLVPTLHRLCLRRNTRIFQDMSAIDVVRMVLDEHRVSFRLTLTKQTRPRGYCVQYRETDLAFVSRLLAEEGIAYFFDHMTSLESTMVIVDNVLLMPMIPGSPSLLARHEMPGMPPEENHVLEFSASETMKTAAVRVRDYDFLRPRMELSGKASAPEALSLGVTLDEYDHHGEYEESDARDEQAALVLSQRRRRARSLFGRTPCSRLAPGYRFVLSEHEANSLNGQFLLTRVDHKGFGAGANPSGDTSYEATFRCTSRPEGIRPKRPPRVLRQVVESATVTGPPGDEIHTDELGRIRVQFHWDPDAPVERTSCWIRVVTAWAGESFGVQFVPRVGMEVLVSFLGGDPDRPVVIGCLPNATHPPPFKLPAAASRSGIRTNSTPGGGGFNEIAFEDGAGREVLSIHAQKDLVHEVGSDASTTVGGDRRVNVSGNDTIHVLGDRSVHLSGSLREEMDGDHGRFVMGTSKLEHFGDREVISFANDRARIEGSMIRTVRGEAVLTTNGHATMTVGDSDMAEAQLQVSGTMALGASKGIRIVSSESITLSVGDNSIVISEEGITLDAKLIRLLGAEGVSAEGPGPTLLLGEEAQINAKVIRLFAKKARIEMEDDASIKGEKVLLNCDATDPTEESEEKQQEKKKLTLRFTDPTGEPYAEKHYRTAVRGVIAEGETSINGEVKIEAPPEAKIVQVRIWIGEYPEGATRDYAVNIEETLPPVDTPRGVKQRLHNLGFLAGKVNDDGSDLTEVLLRFQRDRGLETTGLLDAATKAELEKAHGY